MAKLTLKQERFCIKYMESGNASEAYRFAYSCSKWKADSVNRAAHKLLYNIKVIPRIEQLRAEEKKRLQSKHHITQDRLMQEYKRIGLSSVINLFNPDGTVKPPHELDEDTAAAVSSVKQEFVKLDKNGKPVFTYEYKLIDKKGPITDMAKMLGMFEEDNQQRQTKTEVVVENKLEVPEWITKGAKLS